MNSSEISFAISEKAKKRESSLRLLAGVSILIAATLAFLPVLPKMLSLYGKLPPNQRIIDAVVMVLVVLLWLAVVALVIVGAKKICSEPKMFSGYLVIDETSIRFGSRVVPRTEVDRVKEYRRRLLIFYSDGAKKCRLNIPLSWLPRGAGDAIQNALKKPA
jgi:hypothetical protein